MKQRLILTIVTVWMGLSVYALTVSNVAGGLSSQVQDMSITTLTITGTMNADDFYFIGDSLRNIASLDLSQVEEVVSCVTSNDHYRRSHYPKNTIPMGCFADLPLTNVSMPLDVSVIEAAAFAGCRQLTTIAWPAALDSIGDYAFTSCEGLVSVELPAQVKWVGSGAFARCSALKQFAVADGSQLQYLGAAALMDCPQLASISLGTQLETMDDAVLAGSGIESLDLTKSAALTTIGDWAFANSSLTQVAMPTSVTMLGEGAFLYSPLCGVSWSNRLGQLNNYLLAGTTLSGSLDLPASITTIGRYALYNVDQLANVKLGAALNYMGDYAMAGMIGLQQLTSLAMDVPSLGAEVWAGVNQSAIPLIVEDEALEDYKAAEQWKEFLVRTAWVEGDVNGDGIVSIADINAIIDIILGRSVSEEVRVRADVNGDGVVTIADINAVINILLVGGDYAIEVNCDETLALDDLSISVGEERTVEIELLNQHAYSAMQCDIVLPQGLTLVGDVTLTARSAQHERVWREREHNTRVLLYSMTKQALVGHSGAVLTFTVRADAALPLNSQITLDNIMLADDDNINWHCASVSAQVTNRTAVEDMTSSTSVDKVWASGHMLYIETQSEGEAQIVMMNGVQRTMPVSAGLNQQAMDAGIYVVRLNNVSHKVIIR